MAIYNKADLRQAVADYAKRKDAEFIARIDDFLFSAHVKICEYAGELDPIDIDSATNSYIVYYPLAYIYGALVEAADYLRDTDLLQRYAPKFQERLDMLAMHQGFDELKMIPSGPTP